VSAIVVLPFAARVAWRDMPDALRHPGSEPAVLLTAVLMHREVLMRRD
jgi:hypothetical protein